MPLLVMLHGYSASGAEEELYLDLLPQSKAKGFLYVHPDGTKECMLDIKHWNFHWQNAYTLAKPVEAEPGDVVRVTCRCDVGKRLHLGTAVARTPRYVLWGEGTTDEMCLGILQVTHG